MTDSRDSNEALIERREFLKAGTLAGVAALMAPAGVAKAQSERRHAAIHGCGDNRSGSGRHPRVSEVEDAAFGSGRYSVAGAVATRRLRPFSL